MLFVLLLFFYFSNVTSHKLSFLLYFVFYAGDCRFLFYLFFYGNLNVKVMLLFIEKSSRYLIMESEKSCSGGDFCILIIHLFFVPPLESVIP